MESTQRCSLRFSQHVQSSTCLRNASLTSAIGNGVRKAGAALKRAEAHRVREGTLGFWELKDKQKVEGVRRRARDRDDQHRRLDWLRQDSEALSDDQEPRLRDEELSQFTPRSTLRRARELNDQSANLTRTPDRCSREQAAKLARLRAQGVSTEAPSGTPYTEATSDFLYGTYPVFAALQARRRKLHKLYVECGGDALPAEVEETTTKIVSLAKKHKVPIERVAGSWSSMLDRMAGKRPHNGLVLEAGPIPQIPITMLKQMDRQTRSVHAQLRELNTEDKLALGLNPDQDTCQVSANRKDRSPLLLWLDRITDTGNVGAIMRTAYFLGVDGIILPSHGTAPISAITIKASAGAAEMLPIFTIGNESDFMTRSQHNGWVFYAAAAPESASTSKRPTKQIHSKNATQPFSGLDGDEHTTENPSPSDVLQSRPCVVMLGNEGEGLRSFLQNKADHLIAINGANSSTNLIDSLNVSVAAALLIDRFISTNLELRHRFVEKENDLGVDSAGINN
ncbi:hypothetical protein H2198_003479 [Neophaeococcomyces mojaviensis]|uniref:Uncharacterized protein n=1 Tax=Neophaeococcomyces mojaviensis TaxID=3383035 RepID=A0ACC3AB41_9EURO|nr:hypothetical protein H2198_003479 [Knufia sp. JES_112]